MNQSALIFILHFLFILLESSVPSPTTSPDPNRLEIIAQPCIQGKLRTLKDNEKEKRRNTLKTKTKNPNFTFPAVRVC